MRIAGAPPGTMADRAARAALWIAYRMLRIGWFVFRPRHHGVSIAIWHDGRVLAIRNSYRSCLALPAGGVHRGETALAAARRELREEVAIDVAPEALRFVGDVETDFEFRRDRCSFFELELAEPPAPRVDRREVIWAGFVEPEAALRAHLAPPVRAYLEARLRRQPNGGSPRLRSR